MKRLLSLFLALAGLSASASAQTTGDGVFQKFDKNADGKVTTEELPNPQAFDRFDMNKDGAITLEKYNAVTGGTPSTPRSSTGPRCRAAAISRGRARTACARCARVLCQGEEVGAGLIKGAC